MKLKGQKLKITLLGVLVAFLTTINGNAQNPESSLLWKIEGQNLEQPSYLFGTIHLICEEDLRFMDKVEETLLQCETVVMELDLDQPGFATKMQQQMFHPEMKNFSKNLTQDQKETLNTFFTENFGAGLDQLGVMKPFALLTMLYTKYVGCDDIRSYELLISALAKANKMELRGLETIASQMSLFDQIPEEEMIEWLIDGTDIKKNQEMFNGMVSAYHSTDLNQIYDYIIESSPEMTTYSDLLLTTRNKNWIPQLIEEIGQAPTFIAVGSGHLAGSDGLVALLQKEGYQLTPIKL